MPFCRSVPNSDAEDDDGEAKESPPAVPAPSAAPSPRDAMALKVGTRVVLCELKRSEMNGKLGTVTSVLNSNDRQSVRLDDGWKVVALRPFNFRPAPAVDPYESDGSMPSLESVVDSDEDAASDSSRDDDDGDDDDGSARLGNPTADSYESDGSMPSLESVVDSDEDVEDAEEDHNAEEHNGEHNGPPEVAQVVDTPSATNDSYDSDGSMPSLESVVDSDEEA